MTLAGVITAHGISVVYGDFSSSVVLTNNDPFVYKDENGYTIIVGEVENADGYYAVKDVHITANFYDRGHSIPLEIVEGGSILDVIPPHGKSPYLIRSNSPNPNITQVSVSLSEEYPTSPTKLKQLSVELDNIVLDDTLHFSGVLKNGAASIHNTKVYLAFYDDFVTTRIIGVSTIPIGNVESNEMVNFSFNEKIQTGSVGFILFSESDVFYSDSVDVKIPTSNLSESSINVKTNKSKYNEGDTIILSGKVTNMIPGKSVTIHVSSKSDSVDITQIIVAKDGSYLHTIITKGPLWSKAGEYTVTVDYDSITKSSTKFFFNGGSTETVPGEKEIINQYNVKREKTNAKAEPFEIVKVSYSHIIKTHNDCDTYSGNHYSTSETFHYDITGFLTDDAHKNNISVILELKNDKIIQVVQTDDMGFFNFKGQSYLTSDPKKLKIAFEGNEYPMPEKIDYKLKDSAKKFIAAPKQITDGAYANSLSQFIKLKYPEGHTDSQKIKMPGWLVFPTKLWMGDVITDEEYINILQYLSDENIMSIPNYIPERELITDPIAQPSVDPVTGKIKFWYCFS